MEINGYKIEPRADLSGADLSGANLHSANLHSANLSSADLRSASLSGANLHSANLHSASLRSASLGSAGLRSANLRRADLRSADLSGADLSGANLHGANLSGAVGVPTSAEWLRANVKVNKRGCLLAYKAIGDTTYPARPEWRVEPGSYLTETVNPDRGTECACGVNVGTLDYVRKHYPLSAVWLVGIEPADIADVVVPFQGSGKFRAARVRLIRQLTPAEIKG